MLSFRILRPVLGLLALALLIQPEPGRAQVPPPANSKRHTIETIDGVHLKANLWVGKKGQDGATVILLHNFDKGGGDSQKDGWNALGDALQKAGHSVISFDFRGHGQSLEVNPDKFWSQMEFPYNTRYLKFKVQPGGKLPGTISQTDFTANYYPFLVNDITAIRAFLDKQNDAGIINTKNLIVIGAGQGATLGALWMESELKRRQAVPKDPRLGIAAAAVLPPVAFDFKDPAGQDIAAGIFLSPSPTLGGQPVPLTTWMKDLGTVKDSNKIPLAFLYGGEDKTGSKYALDLLTAVSPNYKKGMAPPKELPFTGEEAIETKLTGSQLLNAELPTEKWIVEKYIPPMLEKRTIIAAGTQAFEKWPAFWRSPTGVIIPVRLRETDEAPRPVPLQLFGIQR